MSETKKGTLIHLGFGFVVATFVVILGWDSGHTLFHLLCDGCFVAAVLLLGSGGLKFVRNRGAFDMMTYSIKTVFHIHLPFTKMNSPLEEREEDFMDYKERVSEKRKSSAELLWAGLAYMIAALVFFVLYLLTSGA